MIKPIKQAIRYIPPAIKAPFLTSSFPIHIAMMNPTGPNRRTSKIPPIIINHMAEGRTLLLTHQLF